MGYEIVDIEFRNQYGGKYLTIYIDKIPEGVTLDDCEKLHEIVEPIIEVLDPTAGQPYVLEISSPGLDRPFKSERDFERNYGKEVEIKLFAPLRGQKLFEGILIEKTENYVVIKQADENLKIEANKIAVARPLIKFE